MANVLSNADRTAAVAALVEGNSIRATARMTGVARNTVTKLLVDLAEVCAEYSRTKLVDLPCKRLQIDEIWEFCYAKEKNVPEDKKGIFGYGDVWTWVAIDADTKLVPSWLVGPRDGGSATELMQDLASRLANPPPGARVKRSHRSEGASPPSGGGPPGTYRPALLSDG